MSRKIIIVLALSAWLTMDAPASAQELVERATFKGHTLTQSVHVFGNLMLFLKPRAIAEKAIQERR